MELSKDSRRDFLTDFYMKEELDPMLMKVKAECKIYKRPFSILVIDVDHFKAYNDKYGHLDGDEVLKYFSSTLRLSLDEGECIPFRFGGDEFVIVFLGKNKNESYAISEELRKNLKRRPFLMRGRVFKMSFSGGIVSYPADGEDVELLLDKADKAMYYSKTHGRGRTTLYSSMWFETFKRIFLLFAVFGVIYGAVYYGSHAYRINIKDLIDRIKGAEPVRITLSNIPIKIDDGNLVTVYLKSGTVYKGVVISENNHGMNLKLSLDRGEGAVFIKRQDIERIDRPASKKQANEDKEI